MFGEHAQTNSPETGIVLLTQVNVFVLPLHCDLPRDSIRGRNENLLNIIQNVLFTNAVLSFIKAGNICVYMWTES